MAKCTDKPPNLGNRISSRQLWTYTEVEHTQSLDTISLFPANIVVVDHGLEVRKGMVWWWGEGKKLRFFWG